MLVLESGSLGLLAAADGGGDNDEMGLPLSSLISGDRGLQSTEVGEDCEGWTDVGGSCRATKATAAASLD